MHGCSLAEATLWCSIFESSENLILPHRVIYAHKYTHTYTQQYDGRIMVMSMCVYSNRSQLLI